MARVKKSKRIRHVHLPDGSVWEYHIRGNWEGGTIKIIAPAGHPRFPQNKKHVWRVEFKEIDPIAQQQIDNEEREYQEALERGEEWWCDTNGGGSPWQITPSAVKRYILNCILNQSAANAT